MGQALLRPPRAPRAHNRRVTLAAPPRARCRQLAGSEPRRRARHRAISRLRSRLRRRHGLLAAGMRPPRTLQPAARRASHWCIGTTGFAAGAQGRARGGRARDRAAGRSQHQPRGDAAHRAGEQAAPRLSAGFDIEIIEAHHRTKPMPPRAPPSPRARRRPARGAGARTTTQRAGSRAARWAKSATRSVRGRGHRGGAHRALRRRRGAAGVHATGSDRAISPAAPSRLRSGLRQPPGRYGMRDISRIKTELRMIASL